MGASGSGENGSTQPSERFNALDCLKFLINICVMISLLFQVRINHKTPEMWSFFLRCVEPWMMPAAALASGLVYDPVYSKLNGAKSFRLIAAYFPLQFFYLMLLKLCVLDQHHEDMFLYPRYVKLDSSKDPLPWYLIIGDFVRPFWHLWYIWSLFIWRILAPMWMQLKQPIIFSMILALMSGFFYAEACEVYRTLGYFPYFIIGCKIKRDGLPQMMQLLDDKTIKVWSVGILVLNMCFAWYATHIKLCHNYLGIGSIARYVDMKCEGAYHDDIDVYWVNIFARLASYPLGGVLVLAIISLMPSGDNLIRQAGSRVAGPYTLLLVPYMIIRSYTGLVDNWHAGNVIVLFIIQILWDIVLYIPQLHDKVTQYLLYLPLEALGVLETSE